MIVNQAKGGASAELVFPDQGVFYDLAGRPVDGAGWEWRTNLVMESSLIRWRRFNVSSQSILDATVLFVRRLIETGSSRSAMNTFNGLMMLLNAPSFVEADLADEVIPATGQPPPIGFGLTFHVLAETGMFPMVELQKVYRQTGTSGIPAVSRSIRNGAVPDLPQHVDRRAGVSFVACDPDRMVQVIEDVAADLGGIGSDLRILSAVKAGPAGIFGLNDRFHRIMAAGRETALGYAIGEPVMFLKNDYQRGLRNGSLGTVTGFDGGLVSSATSMVRSINSARATWLTSCCPMP